MIGKLQYISQEPHLIAIREACEAGCDWIQLRVKNRSDEECYQLAVEAKKITDHFGAKLIINDHLQAALRVKAYGVHLGKKDMNLAEARKMAGRSLVIGGSTNSLEDILVAVDQGVDYLGLGPYRYTTTKTDLNPVLGLEGISKIMKEVERRDLKVPIIAIGGIRTQDLPALMETGVYGVAVSGTISVAVDKKKEVNDIRLYLK